MKQTEVKKQIIQHGFQSNNLDKNSQKYNLSFVRMRKNEVCVKMTSESLASRAKRRSEEKVKQICKNICVPPHDKSVKSPKYTATLSKPKKTLQRHSFTSSESLYKQKASSCSSEIEKGDKQLPKQPVNSLIRVYDKSLKDKISVRKESNIYFERTKNKNTNIHQMNTNNSKQVTAIDGRKGRSNNSYQLCR